MDDLIKNHLQDILTAIEEVESFFGNAPKVYDDFYSNLCLRRAVERNIEIIGEAMNRILKVDKDIAITNSRKIVDARNYIIHGYDSLSVGRCPPFCVNRKLQDSGFILESCFQI